MTTLKDIKSVQRLLGFVNLSDNQDEWNVNKSDIPKEVYIIWIFHISLGHFFFLHVLDTSLDRSADRKGTKPLTFPIRPDTSSLSMSCWWLSQEDWILLRVCVHWGWELVFQIHSRGSWASTLNIAVWTLRLSNVPDPVNLSLSWNVHIAISNALVQVPVMLIYLPGWKACSQMQA